MSPEKQNHRTDVSHKAGRIGIIYTSGSLHPHPRQEVKGKLALAPATERMVLETGESVANGHTSEAADTEEEGQERRGKQVIISTIYHTVYNIFTISTVCTVSTCAGAGPEEPC